MGSDYGICESGTIPRTVEVTNVYRGEASTTLWSDSSVSLFIGGGEVGGDLYLNSVDDALALLDALTKAVQALGGAK